MKVLLSTKEEEKIKSYVTNINLPKLEDGDVLIKTEYSSINFKDALGVTGKGKIFKEMPLVGGIDVAGVVTESRSSSYKIGDAVAITGCGLGENRNGGYAEFVVDQSKNIIHCSKNLSVREAMIYGTAGFTACLSLLRMEQNGQSPSHGPILVTGATGGVGQFAVSFFAKSGYEVHALTGKKEFTERLHQLGAKKVILSEELNLGTKPLEAVIYGGVIDNIGGKVLSQVISHINLWGNVSCIGLADSPQLNTTVMPLILRGVSLLGISSNNTPRLLREKVWHHLSNQLKPSNLEEFVTNEVSLDGVVEAAENILARKTTGRTLVKIG